MTTDRKNFTPTQKEGAYYYNGLWLKDHDVDGVFIALSYEELRKKGQVYYCENCLFCHSDHKYFNVDHLVPDLRMASRDRTRGRWMAREELRRGRGPRPRSLDLGSEERVEMTNPRRNQLRGF